MITVISTAHFEHGLPLLAGLDLAVLIPAFQRLQEGDEAATGDLFRALASAAEARLLRRLAAVTRATTDQLLDAEASPQVLRELERQAASDPYEVTLQEAGDFFVALLGSSMGTPGSSRPEGVSSQPPGGAAAAASPSEGS